MPHRCSGPSLLLSFPALVAKAKGEKGEGKNNYSVCAPIDIAAVTTIWWMSAFNLLKLSWLSLQRGVCRLPDVAVQMWFRETPCRAPITFYSSIPPNGRCWTTTRFPRTSAWWQHASPLLSYHTVLRVVHLTSYILKRPELTFFQLATPVAMEYSCEECSWNGPRLTSWIRMIDRK
jgi:hypothetical protein